MGINMICPTCKIEVADLEYHKKICMNKIEIEVRQDCKECGKDIVEARYRTFCCATCRIKWHNRKRKPYQKDWIAKKRKRLRGIDSDIGIGVK